MQRCIFLILTITAGMAMSQAMAQTPGSTSGNDPYRNFLGNWSGLVLQDSPNPPTSVAIHITEDKQGGRMRWDYWFGVRGKKGYYLQTKWLLFDLAKNEVRSYWDNRCDQFQRNCNVSEFKTVGLDVFNQQGLGHFTGQDGPTRLTVDLQTTTLAYMLEFDDGKKSKILSKFILKRNLSESDSALKKTVSKPSEQH
jgi:hypothetical protein